MRAVVLALLFVIPQVAAAQAPPPVVPILGLGVGATQLPEPLVETGCKSPRTFPTIELMAGIAGAAWRAEARGAAFGLLVVASCQSIGVSHESGIHTDRVYPYERRHGDLSVSAHVRYAPPKGIWALGIGAGRLLSANVPFLIGTSALRTRGRLAGVVEVQARLTRLRYDLVTAEWLRFERNREISREQDHEWDGTYAIRLRAEWRLR